MPQSFTEESLQFLARAPFADREWFAANRQVYDDHIVAPMRGLIAALTPAMDAHVPGVEGTLSRIYRDMRFARGGSVLRENAWICFHEPDLAAEERPEFFFELFADRYRYGMGFYSAPRSKMEAFRRAVDHDPAGFGALVAPLPADLQLMGESYKQSRAAHLPEPLRTWYDRKSLWVQVEHPIDGLLLGPATALVQRVLETFVACMPLYRYLRNARPERVVQ